MSGVSPRQAVIDLYTRHKYADAAEAAHAWLERNPADIPVMEILADSAIQSGHLDAGRRVAEYLVSLDRTPNRLAALATVLSAHGDLGGAAALLKEALSRDPAHPKCWGLIAGLYRFSKDDPLIAKAKRMLRQKQLPDIPRRAILYALSRAMNDLGKWDRAWDYAAEGAKLAKPDYDPGAFDHWVEDLAKAFDPEFLEPRLSRGVHTGSPVFIVGMPRSGTTLMESILAATGQVTPMGELTTIPDVTEQAVKDDLRRGNAEAGFGQAELRLAGDDGDIADAGQPQAAADGGAFHQHGDALGLLLLAVPRLTGANRSQTRIVDSGHHEPAHATDSRTGND